MSGKRDYQGVILYDLEALKDCFITRNKREFNYHFRLLKGNLKDYFNGKRERRQNNGNRSKKS